MTSVGSKPEALPPSATGRAGASAGFELGAEASVAVRLRVQMPSFTQAEKKIGRAILASYPLSGLESARNLAEIAGVSAPSVVRFVRMLGFKGYKNFQESLIEDLRVREESNLSQATDRCLNIEPQFDSTRRAFHRGIDQTFNSVIGDDIDHTVGLLAQTRKSVALVGATYTGSIADIFHAQLVPARSGVLRLSANPLVAAGELLDLRRGDVLVVFDVRRYDQNITDIAQISKELGLTVVVFTDPWLSPAASIADHVLTADVRAAGPSDTLVPMLALVEMVSEIVVAKIGHAGIDRLTQIDPIRRQLGRSKD